MAVRGSRNRLGCIASRVTRAKADGQPLQPTFLNPPDMFSLHFYF